MSRPAWVVLTLKTTRSPVWVRPERVEAVASIRTVDGPGSHRMEATVFLRSGKTLEVTEALADVVLLIDPEAGE